MRPWILSLLGCALIASAWCIGRIDPTPEVAALDSARAGVTRGALQEPKPAPEPTPVYEYCNAQAAGPVCAGVLGDGCTGPGDTCKLCNTPPNAVYRKCKTTTEVKSCDRAGGGGIVDCGVKYLGVCDEDGTCHANATTDACNESGSLTHECAL